MPKIIEADFTPPKGRFAIVAARFNGLVVDALVSGAINTLTRHGVKDDKIHVVHVPGSFEIPLVARQLVRSGKYAGVVCLGCIIRGDTDHYDHVAGAAVSGIADVARSGDVPVIFGVLTCETLEQAQQRAGAKAGNKGAEAALAVIEMVNLVDRLRK